MTVIGAGYVGLVTAACLSELGHHVAVVEKNFARLESLTRGVLPIFEPGLEQLVQRNEDAGRLSFTGDYALALQNTAVVVIAVNTPATASGEADMSFVNEAVAGVLEYATHGLTLVLKSTVPVGTANAIQAIVHNSPSHGIQVVSNPEFLRQGSAVQDFLEPDRIVIGSSDPRAAARVAALYDDIDSPIIYCSQSSAEMAKYVANALLATRISFLNEVAAICDATFSDITEVTQIVGLDHRIGEHYLRAGLGWGGSCLPKDVAALTATAYAHGCRPQVLEAVTQVNVLQPAHALRKLERIVEFEQGTTVGILGLAFKPDTDDLRGAPSTEIISRLLASGVNVRAHDPAATEKTKELFPGITYCNNVYELSAGCDAVILCTEWQDYVTANWQAIRETMRRAVVLDGRNALDPDRLRALGFTYLSIGRAVPPDCHDLDPVAADLPIGGAA